jgi:hypothetical protein
VVVGIRETLNENRSVTVGAAIGMTVLAVLWIIYYSLSGGNSGPGPGAPPSAPPASRQSN